MSQLQTETDVSASSTDHPQQFEQREPSYAAATPVPSTDPRLLEVPRSDGEVISPRLIPQDDIFKIPPLTALKLLGAEIEALVTITGDIPYAAAHEPNGSEHARNAG